MICRNEAERRTVTILKCHMLKITHVCDDVLTKLQAFAAELDRISKAFATSEAAGISALRNLQSPSA